MMFFTAKIAAEVGFDALVMGGYSIAASRLGQPDVGYLSMTEMVQAVNVLWMPQNNRYLPMVILVTEMR